MTITLTASQEEWIAAHVARGEFSSIEEGARRLIEERILEIDAAGDDFAWAKALVDEGLADLESGNVIEIEEFGARNAAHHDAGECRNAATNVSST